MLSGDKPKTKFNKKSIFTLLLTGLTVCIVLGAAIYYYFINDYSHTAAAPIEKALLAHNIKKECSRGSSGHGPDTRQPWYYAIYQVPGDRDSATKLFQQAVMEGGYNLDEYHPDINIEDNTFYRDTSKRSSFWGLKDGNIEVSATVYGSKVYDSSSEFCTLKAGESSDITTVILNLSLPEYR